MESGLSRQWARSKSRSQLARQSRCFDLPFLDQKLDSTPIAQNGKTGEQYEKEECRRQQNGDLPPSPN